MALGILTLLFLALAAAFLWLRHGVLPGHAPDGPPAPFNSAELDLARRLEGRVRVLAQDIGERNYRKYGRMEQAALAVSGWFAQAGLQPEFQEFQVAGRTFRNVLARLPGADPDAGCFVVAAHYDTVAASPGADDNASAVAALVELARLLGPGQGRRAQLLLAAVANEEPPFFMTSDMGSFALARALSGDRVRVRGMVSLEMLGYFRDEPGTQKVPAPIRAFYPDRADFIALVGNTGSRPLVKRCLEAFRRNSDFPVQAGALPAAIPGIAFSDQWSFWRHGFQALMVTDTAYNRNPHYHKPTDTPDTLDYPRMARVVQGLAGMLRDLADDPGMD